MSFSRGTGQLGTTTHVGNDWYQQTSCHRRRFYLTLSMPRSQDEVSQGKVHGWVTRKFWKLVELVQLHHVWPHTQSLATFVRLVERLEVRTQTWNWQHIQSVKQALPKVFYSRKWDILYNKSSTFQFKIVFALPFTSDTDQIYHTNDFCVGVLQKLVKYEPHFLFIILIVLH